MTCIGSTGRNTGFHSFKTSILKMQKTSPKPDSGSSFVCVVLLFKYKKFFQIEPVNSAMIAD